MWPASQETADLVSFTEEIFNWKIHFLCSDRFALTWGSTHMLIFLSNISKFLKLETGKYAKKYHTYGFFIVLGNVTLIFLRTWPRSKFLWICNIRALFITQKVCIKQWNWQILYLYQKNGNFFLQNIYSFTLKC